MKKKAEENLASLGSASNCKMKYSTTKSHVASNFTRGHDSHFAAQGIHLAEANLKLLSGENFLSKQPTPGTRHELFPRQADTDKGVIFFRHLGLPAAFLTMFARLLANIEKLPITRAHTLHQTCLVIRGAAPPDRRHPNGARRTGACPEPELH